MTLQYRVPPAFGEMHSLFIVFSFIKTVTVFASSPFFSFVPDPPRLGFVNGVGIVKSWISLYINAFCVMRCHR